MTEKDKQGESSGIEKNCSDFQLGRKLTSFQVVTKVCGLNWGGCCSILLYCTNGMKRDI